MNRKQVSLDKLRNRKVKDKLNHTFSITLAFMTASIVIAFFSLLYVSNRLRVFYQGSYNSVTLASQSQYNLQEGAKNMLFASLVQDGEATEARLGMARENFENTREMMQQLGQSSSADPALFETTLNDMNLLISSFSEFETYCRANDSEGAFDMYNAQYAELIVEMADNISAIEEFEDLHADSMYRNANIAKYGSIVLVVLLSCLSFNITLIMSKTLAQMLNDSIQELKDSAVKMTGGDFDIEISYESQDELGELADAMRHMIYNTRLIISDTGEMLEAMADNNFDIHAKMEERYIGIYKSLMSSIRQLNYRLNETLHNISDASSQVSSGAIQLAQNAQALAEGATDQAGAIQELTATIEDVTSMAMESAQNQETAAENVNRVAREATRGKEEIGKLLEAMNKISNTSKEIENIAVSIEDIASQTNLLSLNASIEAARAGESGRGFAVVADQIGKLAADSAQSAVNTRELIAKALEEIDNGNAITENTATVLEEVLNSMNEIQEIAKNASMASQTQASMLRDISHNIEKISSIVEANTSSAEENSATSEELTSQSDTMNNMIAEFRLRAD